MLINTEIELLYYFITSLVFALEITDTVEFIKRKIIVMNFKFIDTGSTRIVFLIGNHAVKIPRFIKPDNSFYGKLLGFLWGWEANRTEYIWSKSNLYSFLNPVKLSLLFSLILIFDRTQELSENEFFNLNPEDYNFGSYEHKMDSFGKINSEIRIIDYGN